MAILLTGLAFRFVLIPLWQESINVLKVTYLNFQRKTYIKKNISEKKRIEKAWEERLKKNNEFNANEKVRRLKKEIINASQRLSKIKLELKGK